MSTHSQTGSILVKLALVLCLISAGLAGWVTYLRWQQQSVSTTTTQPALVPNDPLLPTITIDPALVPHTAKLEQALIIPLRQYYATRPEHLDAINITPSPDKTYAARVSITLKKSDTPTHIFGYGTRSENTLEFPAWKPAFLDQEV